MKWSVIIVALLLIRPCYSQNSIAYSDYRNYFYIFDNGIKKEMEYLPVKSYKNGASCIAYQDNSGTLKIYYNKKVYELLEGATDFYVTKNICVGKCNGQLKIFDNGKTRTISRNTEAFEYGDSIIAFYDNQYKTFNAYYNDSIIQLEDMLTDESFTEFKAGNNMVTYVNNQSEFTIFYRGKKIKLFLVADPFSYKVGQDIIAFTNYEDLSLNVFRNFAIKKIESQIPSSFLCGKNCVVYVDESGSFKMYKDGKTEIISNIKPDFYYISDEMVIYSEENYFKIYLNGTTYLLETYIPSSYKYDQHCIAYKNNMGVLKFFDKGKTNEITHEVVKNYEINGSVLTYISGNTNKTYFNGKIY